MKLTWSQKLVLFRSMPKASLRAYTSCVIKNSLCAAQPSLFSKPKLSSRLLRLTKKSGWGLNQPLRSLDLEMGSLVSSMIRALMMRTPSGWSLTSLSPTSQSLCWFSSRWPMTRCVAMQFKTSAHLTSSNSINAQKKKISDSLPKRRSCDPQAYLPSIRDLDEVSTSNSNRMQRSSS